MLEKETRTTESEEIDAGCLYSNFDHALDRAVEATLKGNPNATASHPAWNFHATVRCSSDGQWTSEVRRYGSLAAVLVGETAMDVIREANDRFGSK